jgi:hypothetical protein
VSGVLQRKCASCGNHTIAGGQCQECDRKKLQTKLQVNEPGDVYEQEADRIADQVMAMSAYPGVSTAPPRIQRFSGQSNGQMDVAPASVDQALASPGRPLEPALRQDMEQRFSHDFSRVRVHSGAAAEQSARDVNATAYTVGRDIVFGADRFVLGTRMGRRLLAHELTHVIQQESGDAQIQRKPVAKDSCVARDPGETKASASEPYDVMELSPQQEWLIYGFGVGSSTIDPAKGDIAGLMSAIEWSLAQGHFFYVLGQDPVEVLGYSDCHISKVTPNERLRIERAANFCAAYKQRLFNRLGSHKTFNRFVSSCYAAPAGEYVASNATKEGRSRNRGVLIRVLPPSAKTPTSSLPYDDKYKPTEGNCATYFGAADFLNGVYAHNAYCACSNTPDEPHNNCVRKCLQSKLWPFLAANAEDLRSGRFIWCPTVWKHHRECYAECMCDRSFIDYVAFAPLCTVKTGCPAAGATIALFNPCMAPQQ